MSIKILYGSDPEVFSVYEKEGSLYTLPPYFFRKYLGVSFEENGRHPIFHRGNGFILHEDGAAWEMSITPSYNPKELFDKIQECLSVGEKTILENFPEHVQPKFALLPTVGFEVDRWKNEGEDFRMATEFGCDPDEDAFGMPGPSSRVDASKYPYRNAGGHIHFSGSELFRDEPILAVKCLALTAGLASIHYSDTPELEKLRTGRYGRPGKYRVQMYGKDNPYGEEYANGMEYRTPSTRWTSSWDIAKKVFQWAEIGIHNLLETRLGIDLLDELSEVTVKAITEVDQQLAGELLGYIKTKI